MQHVKQCSCTIRAIVALDTDSAPDANAAASSSSSVGAGIVFGCRLCEQLNRALVLNSTVACQVPDTRLSHVTSVSCL